MLEKYGDIFEQDCDVVVVSTNGFVTKNNKCVMGRGIAKAIKEYYPGIDVTLGKLINSKGNVVHLVDDTTDQPIVVSFPVKPGSIVNDGSNCVSHCNTTVGTRTPGFLAKADISLIERSLKQLVKLADSHKEWNTIICPRFGCGAGELSWVEIKPLAEAILDDRFIVITFGEPPKEETQSLYYTGIGSRDTPQYILNLMTDLASRLESNGYILRSGGADGADQAFSDGVSLDKNKHVYLPWNGFNGINNGILTEAEDWAYDEAKTIHPAWNRCSQGARKLHARNIHQIRGHGSNPKLSEFVVCWTPKGREVGGTATAIKLARSLNIFICNLGNKDMENEIRESLE